MTTKKAARKGKTAEKAATETTVGQRMATQLRKYRGNYKPTVTASQGMSLNNGDDVALLLAGKTAAQICKAADGLLGLKAGELEQRYAKLNEGQKRMNVGNRLRGAVKRNELTIAAIRKAL